MKEEHTSALVELAGERETQQLATDSEIKSLGKRKIFPDANYPYPKKMQREEYEVEKQKLQIELLKMQGWVKETGQRIVCSARVGTRPARAAPSSALWST
jgi:polyphosphate kinase 2 (PPK2 family)